MIAELLNEFGPDADGLLRGISNYVDDSVLHRIAAADYSQDQDRHLAALRQIRDTGSFPLKMAFYPAEVLELTRNDEPGAPSDPVGHWARAFSCAALLRASREPFHYHGDADPQLSLINLLLSLQFLPVDLNQPAVGFLASLMLHSDIDGRDTIVCAYAIGLLWLSLQGSGSVPDEALAALAEWVVRRSDELNAERLSKGHPFPLKIGIDDPPPSPWQHLGTALCNLDISGHSHELRDWIALIGQELAS
jgi:hypothetical protein